MVYLLIFRMLIQQKIYIPIILLLSYLIMRIFSNIVNKNEKERNKKNNVYNYYKYKSIDGIKNMG